MRHAALPIGAALALVAPLQAQNNHDFEPAFSAEDDLDCAIYVGALMAELGPNMTPDNEVGLTSAFTYFTGRYEAQRGINLVQAFTDRYPIYRERNPIEIEQICSSRMRAYAIRLQESGRALERLQPPRLPPGAPQSGSPPEPAQ